MSDAAPSEGGTMLPGRRLWGHSHVTGSDGVTRRTHEMRDGDGTWHSLDGPARMTFEHCGARVILEIPRPAVGEVTSIGRVSCPLCGEVHWSSDPADFPSRGTDAATSEPLDVVAARILAALTSRFDYIDISGYGWYDDETWLEIARVAAEAAASVDTASGEPLDDPDTT